MSCNIYPFSYFLNPSLSFSLFYLLSIFLYVIQSNITFISIIFICIFISSLCFSLMIWAIPASSNLIYFLLQRIIRYFPPLFPLFFFIFLPILLQQSFSLSHILLYFVTPAKIVRNQNDILHTKNAQDKFFIVCGRFYQILDYRNESKGKTWTNRYYQNHCK